MRSISTEKLAEIIKAKKQTYKEVHLPTLFDIRPSSEYVTLDGSIIYSFDRGEMLAKTSEEEYQLKAPDLSEEVEIVELDDNMKEIFAERELGNSNLLYKDALHVSRATKTMCEDLTDVVRVRGFEVVKGKAREGEVKLPERATKFSAGYDFYASEDVVIPSVIKQLSDTQYDGTEPIGGEELEDLTKELGIRPTLIPTGVKSYMRDNEYLQLASRSSGGLKRGLIMTNGIGVIDSDYYSNPSNDGEIYFQFLNYLPFDVKVSKGEAIGQGIFLTFGKTDDDKAQGTRMCGHGSTTEEE